MLPVDHPKRTEAQLDSAVAMLEAGNPTSCRESVLKPMMEQNDQVITGSCTGQLLALNHVLFRHVICVRALMPDPKSEGAIAYVGSQYCSKQAECLSGPVDRNHS